MTKCCKLCKPNSLEIEHGLNTCRNTLCGCHFSQQTRTLEQLQEQLNKFYGSMFEAGDFDELTKLFTLTYQEATKAERKRYFI